MKVKMKLVKRKILSKYEKNPEKRPCKTHNPLELLACKKTKNQGVKTVRNSEQITKNLLYIMLMNSFQQIFYQKF